MNLFVFWGQFFHSQIRCLVAILLLTLVCSIPSCKSQSASSSPSNGSPYEAPKNRSMPPQDEISEGKGVHLVVDVPPKPFAGTEIVIKLIVQNDSNEEIWFAETLLFRDYSFEIKDSSGTIVPMTRFGRLIFAGDNSEEGRRISRELASGKNISEGFNIARLWDLTISGRYNVSVSRTVMGSVSHKPIKLSTKAVLDVQEPPWTF